MRHGLVYRAQGMGQESAAATPQRSGLTSPRHRGNVATMQEFEYMTTTCEKYSPNYDVPPAPIKPDGKGWRLVAATSYCADGVRHHWFWERKVQP